MQRLFNRYKVIIIIIVAYIVVTIAGNVTSYYAFENMDDYQVITNSYNRDLSDSLRNALLHTGIKVLEIKAMVYDSIKGSSYHYVVCSLKLKENYLTDEATEKEMRRTILTRIFEMFPPDLYTGKIRVEYKGVLNKKVTMFPLHINQLKYNI